MGKKFQFTERMNRIHVKWFTKTHSTWNIVLKKNLKSDGKNLIKETLFNRNTGWEC